MTDELKSHHVLEVTTKRGKWWHIFHRWQFVKTYEGDMGKYYHFACHCGAQRTIYDGDMWGEK